MQTIIFVTALIATESLAAQGFRNVDFVEPRPDYSKLYERLSGSDMVLIGRVASATAVSRRSLKLSPRTVNQNGVTLIEAPIQDVLAGELYSVDVETLHCRRSEFLAKPSASLIPAKRIQIFLPLQMSFVESDLFPGRTTTPMSRLMTGRRYLLFLCAPNDDEKKELIAEYELEPSGTYYRAFEGWRGAREMPEGAEIGVRTDYVTPTVAAISSFCEAVRSPDPQVKIGRLKTLMYSAEPGWRDSVDAAIRALEIAQAPRP